MPSQSQLTLRSHIARIERAGQLFVVGAFDDGAGVGEDGQFVVVDEEAQEKFVLRDLADGAQALGQQGKVETVAVSAAAHLDGVVPAQTGTAGTAEGL